MRISIAFVLNDLWIGFFWKRDCFTQHLFICPFPCCCIQIEWDVRVDEVVKQLAAYSPESTRQELVQKARAIVASWEELPDSDAIQEN